MSGLSSIADTELKLLRAVERAALDIFGNTSMSEVDRIAVHEPHAKAVVNTRYGKLQSILTTLAAVQALRTAEYEASKPEKATPVSLESVRPADPRPPLNGWAPGPAIRRCGGCDCRFTGAPTARKCASCAYGDAST